MTRPVIPDLPAAPVRGEDFSVFATKANAHVAALPAWTSQTNALGAWVETEADRSQTEANRAAAEAVTATNQATEATTQADRAETEADTALAHAQSAAATAGYLGEWSSLTGSVTAPASVGHLNRIWVLNAASLADITTSEPGVTSDWIELRMGYTWISISSTYAAQPSDGILADTSSGSFTVTLPASPSVGENIRINDAAGTFGAWPLAIARNGKRIMGLEDDLLVDRSYISFALTYSDASNGWRIS